MKVKKASSEAYQQPFMINKDVIVIDNTTIQAKINQQIQVKGKQYTL